MTFRIRHFHQCQTIYHEKIHYQPKNYFSAIKNTRFTASPVLEVLEAPYCSPSALPPLLSAASFPLTCPVPLLLYLFFLHSFLSILSFPLPPLLSSPSSPSSPSFPFLSLVSFPFPLYFPLPLLFTPLLSFLTPTFLSHSPASEGRAVKEHRQVFDGRSWN